MMKSEDKSIRGSPKKKQSSLFIAPKGIDLKTYKIVRIAVSGDVPLNRLETAIVDTGDFQRLRSIKELGTTYLVYPTAVHTRFDHSLGTLSMAVEMIRAIRENKHNTEEERRITHEEEQLIRIVALLHDITHIPFGHTLEDEFCVFPRHDKDTDRTERFLGKGSNIGEIIIKHLGDDLYKRFMKIFTVERQNLNTLGEDLFIYDIVNNTVCADLLDYLRRDCYFCNIVLDMEYRFLKYLYLRKEGAVKRLVVRLWKEGKPTPRRDVLSELIRLLDNRYLLGERVYFHHAKLVTGAMVAGAVQRAKSTGEIKKRDMYEIGDETLLYKLENSKLNDVRKLAQCLSTRKLWKEIYRRTRDTIDAEQTQIRNFNVQEAIMDRWWKDPTSRTTDEKIIAENLGMDSGDFLIHCPDPKMAMKIAAMKVFWNGSLRPLEQCTDERVVGQKLEVILRSHEKLWSIRCFLNPDYFEKKEAVINACEYLFTFDPAVKGRHEESYYRAAVDDIVRSEDLAKNMLHSEYEKRLSVAIDRLTTQTAALRDKKVVRGIVKDAFTT